MHYIYIWGWNDVKWTCVVNLCLYHNRTEVLHCLNAVSQFKSCEVHFYLECLCSVLSFTYMSVHWTMNESHKLRSEKKGSDTTPIPKHLFTIVLAKGHSYYYITCITCITSITCITCITCLSWQSLCSKLTCLLYLLLSWSFMIITFFATGCFCSNSL